MISRSGKENFIAAHYDWIVAAVGALALVGVYEIETGGAAIAAGEVVSVDPETGKACAASAAGAVKFGHAVNAAAASDALVLVRLQQGL